MGKIKTTAYIISLLCLWSCDGKIGEGEKTNPFSIVEKIVEKYVVDHRKEHGVERTVYFRVDYEDHFINDSLFIFSVYPSGRPLESTPMPFAYERFDIDEYENVAFYYSNDSTASEELIKELKQKDLMLCLGENGEVPVDDPDFMGSWVGWTCIVCKSDYSHYEIVKSRFAFSMDDIPEDFECP